VWRPAKRIASSLSLANARRADSNEFLFAMSVILIHTSGEGKVCPCRRNKRYSYLEDRCSEPSYWILENHPISRLINREAKLGKQTVTEQAGFAWEDRFPMNTRGDRIETLLPELHGSIDVTNRYA
jgi:hypothetical protein